MAAAIAEYGFKVPVVIRNGEVGDGHLRLKAAIKLKMKEVPTVDASHMTDEQFRAFRISINRMAELADWDAQLLNLEFDELRDMGVDLGLTGFTEAERNELMWDEGEIDTDPTAEKIKTSGGEAGMLYKKFGMPPFTVLDQNNAEWQARRQQWTEMGI